MFKKEFQPLSIEKRDSNITTTVTYFRLPRSTVKGIIDLLVERGDVCLGKSSSKRSQLMTIPFDKSLQTVVATLNQLMRTTFVLSSKFSL